MCIRDRAEGRGLTNTFGESASHNSKSLNQMGKMAFAGSVNSQSQSAVQSRDDRSRDVRKDGVDMGVGKGDFYDHKMGLNGGPSWNPILIRTIKVLKKTL